MTFTASNVQGLTRWGVFHNLDAPNEEVGYVNLHVAGYRLGLYWGRL